MSLRKILVGVALLVCTCVSQADELPEGVEMMTSVGGITEYRLENEMKVLLFPDPSAPKTTVNITYLVGSRHEGYGETGMAHLLEHLLFKGSTEHTNIPQELTEHGASANGTTWYDRTNYYETFPSSEENLNWALSLESDRMVNSFVAQKDLDSEMTVVRNEFERGENSPSGILNERVFSTAYLWHNYGQSTIGARSDIENVPIKNLQAFYRKFYQPDNAILIVAGKFDTAKTLGLIAEKFGTIPKPERKLIPTYTAEPTQDGEREVELKRTGEVKVVAAAYHIPAGSDPEFAAVDVLGEILGDTPSGRLYKRLVKGEKIATGVSGGAYQLHDPSLLYLSATSTKDGDIQRVQEALIEAVQSLATNPPTEEEVQRAKTALLQVMEKTSRNSGRLALQLSEWAAMGDWRLFFLYRERLKGVTKDDVAEAAKKYLKTSNRTVGRFIPVETPERAQIAALDLNSLNEALNDLKVADEVDQGEVFDTSPSNIKSRTIYSKIDNRIELAMLPKKTRGKTVQVRINFPFGNLQDVQGKGDVAAFTGGLLMAGTTNRSREEIKDELTKLSASGSVSGSYSSVGANFSTTRENLPQVLALAADVMKNPSFPQSELDTMRNAYLASLSQAKTDPGSQAGHHLSLAIDPYAKGDPRATTSYEEDEAAAKAITIDQLKAYHQSHYGANRGQIAVVGDFEPDETKKTLEELFGNWVNSEAPGYERLQSKMKTIEQGKQEKVVIPDKANAVYYAQMKMPISDSHPDYAALRLANYILGGGFLNSRLATRVRQKEGLSYSISSSLVANSQDPVGSFTVYAISAPENMAKVDVAIREELDRAIRDGFTADEVEAARKGYLESLKVARSKDGNLAYLLQNYLFIDRDIEWLNAWDKKLEGLTVEQINEATKRHLDPNLLTIVTAGSLPE